MPIKKLIYTDTPDGTMGTATITENGRVEDLFNCSKVEEAENIKIISRKVAGFVREQSKPGGIEASTVKCTIFHITSRFLKMVDDYERTGKLPAFTFTRTSTLPDGRQELKAFYDCYLKGTTLTSIDWNADDVEESIEFSYNSAKVLKTF